jgi:hypothetical protein
MTGKKDKDQARDATTTVSRGRELYWDALGGEAVERVGRGPQLKGTIAELRVRDIRNVKAAALLSGQTTKQTASTNARVVDLFTIEQSGCVVERIQVKDVTSSSGMRDLTRRIESAQYRTARLVGTRETAVKYSGTGCRKPMEDARVSSTSTTRAADNAGARVRNRDLLSSNIQDIAKLAGGAAVIGGALGGVVEAVHSFDQVRDGRIDELEYTRRIAASTATNAGGAAARTGAALLLKEGAKEMGKRTGYEILKRGAGSNVGTAVAFGLVEQTVDTARLVAGSIDGAEYGRRSCQNVGSTGGALGGVTGGALIGSLIFPGAGTAIGAVFGGILGGLGGGAAGRGIGKCIWDE